MDLPTYLYFVYENLSSLAHYANPESEHIHAVCVNKQNKRLRQPTTRIVAGMRVTRNTSERNMFRRHFCLGFDDFFYSLLEIFSNSS